MCLHEAGGTPKPVNLKNDRKLCPIFELVGLHAWPGDGGLFILACYIATEIRDEHTYGFGGAQVLLGRKPAIALFRGRYSSVG